LKQGKNNYILDYYSFNERRDYIETKLIARNPLAHIQLKKIEQGEVNKSLPKDRRRLNRTIIEVSACLDAIDVEGNNRLTIQIF
jgi:hypothetical protein